MVTAEAAESVRFGRTRVVALTGDLLDQEVEAIVVAANCRGVLGAGLSGALRSLGGARIEREAMERAPLEPGSALVTGAHGLADHGIRAVIHAVVHRSLGEPARIEHVRRATLAALLAADAHRIRSLAFPLLGAEAAITTAGSPPSRAIAAAIVEELVGCLRRSSVRLDHVVLVSRFADQTGLFGELVSRARARSWVRLG